MPASANSTSRARDHRLGPGARRLRDSVLGSDGPSSYEATLSEEGGALVWSMRSASDRFRGTFSDGGDTITGEWEQFDADGGWRPWMEITLRKLPE